MIAVDVVADVVVVMDKGIAIIQHELPNAT